MPRHIPHENFYVNVLYTEVGRMQVTMLQTRLCLRLLCRCKCKCFEHRWVFGVSKTSCHNPRSQKSIITSPCFEAGFISSVRKEACLRFKPIRNLLHYRSSGMDPTQAYVACCRAVQWRNNPLENADPSEGLPASFTGQPFFQTCGLCSNNLKIYSLCTLRGTCSGQCLTASGVPKHTVSIFLSAL